MGGVGPGGYFIPLTVMVLAIFPVLFLFIKKDITLSYIIIIILCISYEWCIKEFSISDSFYRVFFMRGLMPIVLGIILYLQFDKFKGTVIPLLIWISGLVFLLGYQEWNWGSLFVNKWISTSFLAAPYAFGIVYFTIYYEETLRKVAATELFGYLGKAPYHIFLFQKLYFSTIIEKQVKNYLGYKKMIVLDILFCIGGGVLFFVVENYIERFLKRRKGNQAIL